MKSDSIRLAWAGALIGVLALSAITAARANPPKPDKENAAAIAVLATAETRDGASDGGPGAQAGADGDAVPVMAGQTEGAAFRVALRVEAADPGERLFLCDRSGNPLEAITPDGDGDAELGPIPPERYGIWSGGTKLGSFRLLENAVLAEADGLLRTDGEELCLERSAEN